MVEMWDLLAQCNCTNGVGADTPKSMFCTSVYICCQMLKLDLLLREQMRVVQLGCERRLTKLPAGQIHRTGVHLTAG